MGKIDDLELQKLIDQGLNQVEIAKHFGVTKVAVCQKLKRLAERKTKVTVMEKAGQIVEKKLDALDQLKKINAYANELLDLLMRWNRGDEEALQIFESQVANKKIRIGKKTEFVKEYKFSDPRQLALRAMGEIREQLRLQMDIFKTLYDLQAVEEFQKEVLTEIGNAAPDIRDRIIHNLKKRRAVRSAFDFHRTAV
jgi:predicted transcriptional regulator